MENHADDDAGPSASIMQRRRYVRKSRKRTLEEAEAEMTREDTLQEQLEDDQEAGTEGEENQDQQEEQQENQEHQDQREAAEGRNVTRELKLKMPEFKGKKGNDPQVHVQVFESWATLRELPRKDWRACFPQTLKGLAQKWYFNYPPEKLPTYKVMKKALIQRFKDEKTDEELLSQLGKMRQKKTNVRQFVEEIKDLARQLSSPPANKNMRAWFLNGTSLKGLAKSEITNPTKSFEELVERAVKMERKGTKRQRVESSSSSSSSESSTSSAEEETTGKSRAWQKEINRLKKQVEELTGVRSKMPSKREKWCLHCRVDTHVTRDCKKCDYCERRGHEWEDCPVRLSDPQVRLAAPAVGNQGNQPPGQPQMYYRQNYTRPIPRKFNCFKCGKEGHFARDCPEVINPPNPSLNQVQPEVAAITRGQSSRLPEVVVEKERPLKYGTI